jgi:hypothetical protein
MDKDMKLYLVTDGGTEFGVDEVTPVTFVLKYKDCKGYQIYADWKLTDEQADKAKAFFGSDVSKICTYREIKRVLAGIPVS